jgi:hypothetical protein
MVWWQDLTTHPCVSLKFNDDVFEKIFVWKIPTPHVHMHDVFLKN